MFKSTKEQLREERRKNEALQAELNRANANLEYVAMMADVDLDEEGADDAQPEV